LETRPGNILSDDEAAFIRTVMARYRQHPDLRPVLKRIDLSSVAGDRMDAIFELQVAHRLISGGVQDLAYEIPGEGPSSLDFGFQAGGLNWRVELMRLNPSGGAARPGTKPMTNCRAKLKISQKLIAKKGGVPRKFPAVDSGPDAAIHVMLVGVRSYHSDMFSDWDAQEILYGPDSIPEQHRTIAEAGLFEDRGQGQGQTARARLHAVGFVERKHYTDGALTGSVRLWPNPALIGADHMADIASAWPL